MSTPGKLIKWISQGRDRLQLLNGGETTEITVLTKLIHFEAGCAYDRCPCGKTAAEIMSDCARGSLRNVAVTYRKYVKGEFSMMEYPLLAFGHFVMQHPHLLRASKNQFDNIVFHFYRLDRLMVPVVVRTLQDDITKKFYKDTGVTARDMAWNDLNYVRRHMHCPSCKDSTGPRMVIVPTDEDGGDERCVLGFLQSLQHPFAFSRWPQWLTEAEGLTPVQKAALFAYAKKWHRVLKHFPALQMLLQLIEAVKFFPFHWDILYSIARHEIIVIETRRTLARYASLTVTKMLSVAIRIPTFLYEEEIEKQLGQQETRDREMWAKRYWKCDDFSDCALLHSDDE